MARTQPFLRSMRLVRGRDFAHAFARGSRARGSILLVVACANELTTSRLGLSIGRSVWKSAVRRNRVRRIFREAFRLEYKALPPGFDYVLVAARPALEPELAATRAELVLLARKATARAMKAPKLPETPAAPDGAPSTRETTSERGTP